ncbi:MAG: flagellar protein FlaG [Telluria sp.]
MQVQPLGIVMPKADTYDRTAAPVNTPAPAVTAPETRNPVQQKDAAAHLGEVSDAVETINQTMKTLAPSLEFSIDTDSKRTVVKVIDQDTQEVIRQMPTVEALEIAKALDRLQGLLIKQKA